MNTLILLLSASVAGQCGPGGCSPRGFGFSGGFGFGRSYAAPRSYSNYGYAPSYYAPPTVIYSTPVYSQAAPVVYSTSDGDYYAELARLWESYYANSPVPTGRRAPVPAAAPPQAASACACACGCPACVCPGSATTRRTAPASCPGGACPLPRTVR